MSRRSGGVGRGQRRQRDVAGLDWYPTGKVDLGLFGHRLELINSGRAIDVG